MDFATRQLIWTILAPLVIGALGVVPWVILRASGGARRMIVNRFCAGLGIALGYLVAHVEIVGWPGWPLTSNSEIVFVIGAAMIGVAGLEAWGLRWAGLRIAMRAGVGGALAWLFLTPGFRESASVGELICWVLGSAVVTAGVWTSTDHLALHDQRGTVATALAVLLGASTLFFLRSGIASLTQQVASLGLALGGSAIVAWFVPAVSVGRGGVGVVIVLFHAMIHVAWVYSASDLAPVVLAVAPLGLWIGSLGSRMTTGAARVLAMTTFALSAGVIILWVLLEEASGESLYG